MIECRYLGAAEFDVAGRTGRVHAVASYGDELWLNTVCGLAIQPYPLTGQAWDEVSESERCARCATVLATPGR